MATAAATWHRNRELLSLRILEALDSWPELHREIFVRAHYWGDAPEMISRAMGLGPGAVRLILEQCERRLYAELRPFREDVRKPDPAGRHLTEVAHCRASPVR